MSLETSLAARDIRVIFEMRGDRWRHVIEGRAGEAWQPLLASIEGDAADDWPPSPPFQELHRSTLADGRDVILLVGRAGTSHWSASVETVEETLRFDIACRHSRAPARLGSEYADKSETHSIHSAEGTSLHTGETTKVFPINIGNNFPCTSRWIYTVTNGDRHHLPQVPGETADRR